MEPRLTRESPLAYSKRLVREERKLTRTSPTFRGGRYRSVNRRKNRLAAGFLDGDFLERFLTLDAGMREKIVKGANPAESLGISERSIDQILGDFQRIH